MSSDLLAERYELGELLGTGGMARVHLATDRTLDRTVAIKVLDPRFARDAEFVERFRREARGAAGLSHPNVVAVYDTGEDGGRHYIVMEHVEGRPLSEVIDAEAPLPPERAARIAAAICEGLAAAHEAGLIHRDVKPGNVLLAEDETVKVTDFGIARALTADTLTRGDRILGTAAYLSPEQAAGRQVDARADLYAVGCVLYQMLSGAPPFTGDTPVAVATKHIREEPPPLPHSIPSSLAAMVDRALAKEPDDRFADAASMAAALRGAARGGDTRILTDPLGDIPGRRIPARWLAAGAVALLLLGGILGLAMMPGGEEPAGGRSAGRGTPTTTSPPSPSPEERDPPTVDEAFASVTHVVEDAVTADEMDEKLGEDVLERAGEALKKHAEGKIDEALKKTDEAGEKLAEGAADGEVTPGAADDVDATLETLAEALRSTPAPAGGTEEGEGRGKGRGKGNEDED